MIATLEETDMEINFFKTNVRQHNDDDNLLVFETMDLDEPIHPTGAHQVIDDVCIRLDWTHREVLEEVQALLTRTQVILGTRRVLDPDSRGIYPEGTGFMLKSQKPYSYPPFYQWRKHVRANGMEAATEYSDRLVTHDYERYNEVCREVWGDKGQYFDQRSPEQIEEFLQKYLDLKVVKLFEIVEHCNMSTGFPYWSFGFYFKR
jgi:hypothetical protein